MSSFAESKADPNAPTTLTAAGYASSAEFQKAANVIAALEHLEPGKFKARILEFDGKAEYEAWLPNQRSARPCQRGSEWPHCVPSRLAR